MIVTVFMVGLAVGASLANPGTEVGRALPCAPKAVEKSSDARPLLPSEGAQRSARPARSIVVWAANQAMAGGATTLRGLAFLIAAYAVFLPLFLPLLNHLGGSAFSLIAVKVVIMLLTLWLALLVGMQFPIANRLSFDGTGAGASRLFTADFIGAFLGALLACTMPLPLIGVTGACLVAALLNVLAGALASRASRPI